MRLFFLRFLGWFFFVVAAVTLAAATHRYITSSKFDFNMPQETFVTLSIAFSFALWQHLCFPKKS